MLGSSCRGGKLTYHIWPHRKHNGRKLVWQANMGTADLKVDFGSKRHELNVSTFQMCILLLFNESDTLTYQVS